MSEVLLYCPCMSDGNRRAASLAARGKATFKARLSHVPRLLDSGHATSTLHPAPYTGGWLLLFFFITLGLEMSDTKVNEP